MTHAPLRTLFFAAAIVLAYGWPAWAQDKDPIDAALDACLTTDQGETSAGMVDCTGKAIHAWDSRLNESYQKALAALDPKSRDLLRAAQRAWVAFRTAEKAAQSGPWLSGQGSAARVSAMGLTLSAIREREQELRLYIPAE